AHRSPSRCSAGFGFVAGPTRSVRQRQRGDGTGGYEILVASAGDAQHAADTLFIVLAEQGGGGADPGSLFSEAKYDTGDRAGTGDRMHDPLEEVTSVEVMDPNQPRGVYEWVGGDAQLLARGGHLPRGANGRPLGHDPVELSFGGFALAPRLDGGQQLSV